jgi:hypothetical protein
MELDTGRVESPRAMWQMPARLRGGGLREPARPIKSTRRRTKNLM